MSGVLHTGAVLLAVCSSLILASIGTTLAPVWFAAVAVALLSTLGLLSLREVQPVVLLTASIGALCLSGASLLSVPGAVALAFAGVLGPRALRARSVLAKGLVLGLALIGGGAAGWVVGGFGSASDEGIVLSAFVVASLLAASPFVIPVDDPMAYRFRSFANASTGVLRLRMVRALVLRRRAGDLAVSLSPRARERLERAWRSLIRASEGRIEGATTSSDVLDDRIRKYVQVLQRSIFAAGRARELSEDLDDAVLAELRLESEDLAATASALEEVRQAHDGGKGLATAIDESAEAVL